MDKENKIRTWGKDKREITLLVLITVLLAFTMIPTLGAIFVTAFFWSSVVLTVLAFQHEKKMNYKKASIVVFLVAWFIAVGIRTFL